MMLLAALILGQATPNGLPLGAIPKQELPAAGCAAFLWSTSPDHILVAMASADPASLRLSIDGAIVDLPRSQQSGAGGFGFGGSNVYGTGDVQATLAMTIVTKTELTLGASVPEATLELDRTGKDAIVMPVAGLIGCTK